MAAARMQLGLCDGFLATSMQKTFNAKTQRRKGAKAQRLWKSLLVVLGIAVW
jgi:hypothetical protein